MTRYIEPPANLPIVPMLANTDKSKPGTEDVHFRKWQPGDMVASTLSADASERAPRIPAPRSLQPTPLTMNDTKGRPVRAPADLLSVDDVAERFVLSRASVYRLVGRRRIPFYRLPGSIRFRVQDVDAFLEAQRTEARPKKQYGGPQAQR
jgi:excisionase family DNA binding protein